MHFILLLSSSAYPSAFDAPATNAPRANIMRAEHVEIDEAKSVFEANYSHVYFILYDTFVQAETNLRQRGKFAAVHSRWQHFERKVSLGCWCTDIVHR